MFVYVTLLLEPVEFWGNTKIEFLRVGCSALISPGRVNVVHNVC